MKKVFASTAALAMALTSLAGCGSGGDITAESGKKNISVAVGGDFAWPDPAIVDDSITSNVLAQCYSGLFKLTEDGGVEADLAAEVPTQENGGISKDNKTYTIKLKDGLKWSDGSDLTAEDFIWSWKRAMTTGGYYTNFMYNYIDGTSRMVLDEETGVEKDTPYSKLEDWDEIDKNMAVEALDDQTIQIKLKTPTTYFASLLTNTVFYPVNRAEVEAGEEGIDKPTWVKNASEDDPIVTSGSFEITGVNIKDTITLKKSANCTDDDVKLESMSFKVMSDLDTQTNSFQSGEVDFATAVNVEAVTKDENLLSHVYKIDPFVCNYYIIVNAGKENNESTDGLKALKDPEIRKAISMGISRSTVRQAYGYGDEFSYDLYGMIPNGIPDAEEGSDFREVGGDLIKDDVEAAKEIMESKGYSADNMLKLDYKYNNLANHKASAEAMQAALKEIYIDLSLTGIEKEAFFGDRDNGKFELARHAMTADYMDPTCYLSMNMGETTPGNTTDDPKFDEMVNEANAMTDPADRLAKLHEAEAYLVENGYIIPLFGYTEPFLKVKNLEGITSSPEGHYDLTHAYFA